MFSKNFVPRVLVGSSLLITLSFSAMAQTHFLGEAWKLSGKSSEGSSKIQIVDTSSHAKAVINDKTSSQQITQPAQVATPIEPNVKPANPPLVLEAEIAEIKSSKMVVNPDEELVGIEPPATFHATAYSLSGRTRTGTQVRRGVIAADPRVLPLGSVVQLKAGNYSGLYTVHDTGTAIRGKRIDVWVPSPREARSFGRQNVRLTVLKYGGGRKPKSK